MIKLEQAYKAFGNTKILENANLMIQAPGMYIIHGESGSGKSTLLNLLAGYDKLDKGTLMIEDSVATIFQNYELLNELSVQDNIFLCHSDHSAKMQDIIQKLKIDQLLTHYPKELSGGQRQRVGIARALFLNPTIILCDEPTESLDIENKNIVMQVLKELSADRIVIIVTHDQQMIEQYADGIYQLLNGNISVIKEYHNELILGNFQSLTFTKKQLSILIHKILFKRTMVFSLLIIALLCLVQGLFYYEKDLFYIPSSTNTLNANMVYLDLDEYRFQKGEDDSILTNTQHIMRFEYPEIDNKKVKANIFPYVDDSILEVEGNIPKGNEILINQRGLRYFDNNWQGKTLTLNFDIAGHDHFYEVTISGVVHEEDASGFNIYYDLDGFYKAMEDENMYLGKSVYTYLTKFARIYQKEVQYDAMPAMFEKVAQMQGATINSPLYEERLAASKSMDVYRLIFTYMELLLLIGAVIFIMIYLIKDTSYYAKVCAILASFGIPIHKIKSNYFKEKIIYFYPLLIIGSGLLGVIASNSFFNIKQNDYVLVVIILIIIMVLYGLLLLLCLHALKKRRISVILKEEK